MGIYRFRSVLILPLCGILMATSQDAQPPNHSHRTHTHEAEEICSGDASEKSVQRMQAVQSLRETQIQIEMLKKQHSKY